MCDELETLLRNLKLEKPGTMNAEQVSELVRAEVNRALAAQKIESVRLQTSRPSFSTGSGTGSRRQ